MSGSGVTITVNDAEISSVLDRLLQRTHTAQPALHGIAQYLHVSQIARFSAQVTPEGEPWSATPLSARYAAWKAKHGFTKGILVLNGYLSGSFRDDISDNVLLFGTNVPYARIQQFGGTVHHEARSGTMLRGLKGGKLISKKEAGKKSRAGFTFQNAEIGAHDSTIPPRPFLGLSSEDRSQILEICQRWLRGEG